ncbi:ABC transporter substrate-binding protein [Pragia fontium]|uniref:Iron complex transport system substrate-binding protein n=2 Tax=Pragia fontium TaxID=82985 RepID=A0AAJ4WB14_9GAMM|nr:ABC transporter substrate-binding protein [Pragia fontium]AKJ42676.1 iron ABC transporter substrate-binding protein [Pragia fontium]SFC91784.1 iron complex transport system substrate-binding protein [Pragia fontium DSM 5563 = ATCC 49100]SUB83024.1 ferrichrome/ferrioxamine B periplasmic transporter [Pragia fontium]VEJ55923.1 ferrichrome/ferrioxamine B periplasmic transporter [Pragia fontium]GKX62474.1 iron ABC transporter substrate-binding protein [Pragia fontium]
MRQLKRSLTKHFGVSLLLGSSLLLSAGAWAETITDIADRKVELPKKVDRILLGEGRLIYAVALLEGDKPLARIAGWQGDFRKLDPHTYAAYKAKFPEIDKIPLIGNTTAESISPEKVLTLKPDVAIFGLSGHGPGRNSELVTQLEKAGVPVVFIDFRTAPLKNTVPSMRILGKALHREQQAERYIQFYQDNVAKITDVTKNIPEDKKPKVFIELKAGTAEDCCGTAGNGNMGDFIDQAGGINIAKGLLPGALGTVNLEKIIATNPDVYIASGARATDAKGPGVKLGADVPYQVARDSLNSVLKRKGIDTLPAVKEGKTYAIWHSFYNSPYNVLAIQEFGKWFYPEQFKDIDTQKTMETLYKEFLAIEPSGTYWVGLPTEERK